MEASPMKPANILIVEDEPVFALDLQDLIWESGGTPIGPARCLQGALELASRNAIDLAIVDLTLADGKTGMAVARLLYETHGIRSVIVSGSVPPVDAFPNIEHVFVRKPVPSEVLRRLMKPVVEARTKLVA